MKTRLSKLACSSLLAAGLTVSGADAHAGPTQSAADALFESAREAMARGDLATACPRFAESHRLDPAPGTLLNLAQCEEKQRKLTAAVTHLGEALAALPKDDSRIAYARERLAALKAMLPTVSVSMPGGAAGARVLVDDIELREASFGVPLPLDPGPHVFVVSAPGRIDAREELTLAESQHVTVELHAGPPQGTGAPAARAPLPEAKPEASGRRRTLAYAALGVGGVGIVTGAVTGLLYLGARSTYQERCDASGCDPEGLDAASRAKSLDLVSPIAFGIGAVGLGVGTYLLLKAPPRRTAIVVDPQLGAQSAGLTLRGAF